MGCGPSIGNHSFYIISTRTHRNSDADVYEHYQNDYQNSSFNAIEKPSSLITPLWRQHTGHHQMLVRGLVGLQNLGNTCFMNCSLQCLSHTMQLVDYFTTSNNWRYEINRSNPLGRNGEVAEAFGELLNTIYGNILDQANRHVTYKSDGSAPVIYPIRLKNTLAKYQPQFRGNNQHDAQELLAFLLDGLHEDLNQVQTKPWVEDIVSDGTIDDYEIAREAWYRYQQRNRSIIVDLLQGQLKCTLKCSECNTQSIKFETFMFLSLPVSTSSNTVQLSDCLEEYCRAEKLDGDHQWRCPTCKTFRDADKSIKLWSIPPILIIHLKRFYHDNNGRRFKINTRVNFPTKNLDLSSIVLSSLNEDSHIYDLYGVSNHHGGMYGGHYTATIRSKFDDNWYVCNDSINHPVDESNVCTNDAYVLYFHRRVAVTRRPSIDSTSSSGKMPILMEVPQAISTSIKNPSIDDTSTDFSVSTGQETLPDQPEQSEQPERVNAEENVSVETPESQPCSLEAKTNTPEKVNPVHIPKKPSISSTSSKRLSHGGQSSREKKSLPTKSKSRRSVETVAPKDKKAWKR